MVENTFQQVLWRVDPANDPNLNLFRLEYGGILHHDDADRGVRVDDGLPNMPDLAVVNDLERDPRPGNDRERTDRGADQVTIFDVVLDLGLPSSRSRTA